MAWNARQAERRRLRRLQLRNSVFELIGWECSLCGELSDDIQVDHPRGREWEPRAVCSVQRQRRYLDEARTGKIRPLCKRCNGGYRPASGSRNRRR
jgi:formylmethanofuran dehydrogenase subunit B